MSYTLQGKLLRVLQEQEFELASATQRQFASIVEIVARNQP